MASDVRARSSPKLDDAWARRTSAAIAAGSREALASLYEERFDLLYRTVRERTRCDESFALDCVQEAMIKVASSMVGLANLAALDAWLRRVVLSAALDRLRNERSRRRREEARAPIESAHAAIDLEDLRTEIAALASEDRSMLRLRFARGLTFIQLGHVVGTTPQAAESRMRRILARLRDALGRGGDA